MQHVACGSSRCKHGGAATVAGAQALLHESVHLALRWGGGGVHHHMMLKQMGMDLTAGGTCKLA